MLQDREDAAPAAAAQGEEAPREQGRGQGGGRNRRAWWDEENDDTDGESAAVDFVASHVRAKGPGFYDGVLGFSQGAALAALLCAAVPTDAGGSLFRFAMLYGGYPPRGLAGAMGVPSLHVWGKVDRQVDPRRSEELARMFVKPAVHVHEGGHFIPTSPDEREVYRAFLESVAK